jgi:hypothetical protein
MGFKERSGVDSGRKMFRPYDCLFRVLYRIPAQAVRLYLGALSTRLRLRSATGFLVSINYPVTARFLYLIPSIFLQHGSHWREILHDAFDDLHGQGGFLGFYGVFSEKPHGSGGRALG